jgi:hypothetical protein
LNISSKTFVPKKFGASLEKAQNRVIHPRSSNFVKTLAETKNLYYRYPKQFIFLSRNLCGEKKAIKAQNGSKIAIF